jgi:hypothetical protein
MHFFPFSYSFCNSRQEINRYGGCMQKNVWWDKGRCKPFSMQTSLIFSLFRIPFRILPKQQIKRDDLPLPFHLQSVVTDPMINHSLYSSWSWFPFISDLSTGRSHTPWTLLIRLQNTCFSASRMLLLLTLSILCHPQAPVMVQLGAECRSTLQRPPSSQCRLVVCMPRACVCGLSSLNIGCQHLKQISLCAKATFILQKNWVTYVCVWFVVPARSRLHIRIYHPKLCIYDKHVAAAPICKYIFHLYFCSILLLNFPFLYMPLNINHDMS